MEKIPQTAKSQQAYIQGILGFRGSDEVRDQKAEYKSFGKISTYLCMRLQTLRDLGDTELEFIWGIGFFCYFLKAGINFAG